MYEIIASKNTWQQKTETQETVSLSCVTEAEVSRRLRTVVVETDAGQFQKQVLKYTATQVETRWFNITVDFKGTRVSVIRIHIHKKCNRGS